MWDVQHVATVVQHYAAFELIAIFPLSAVDTSSFAYIQLMRNLRWQALWVRL